MKKYDSEHTIDKLIDFLLDRLNELYAPLDDCDNADFILGSKTAYVECLEMLQSTWEYAAKSYIPSDVEKDFPI